ncbi:unnamed protein product [Didymodactylos carnosus]|uniref:Uncharacterized protein n=1 Tax=Didymodactylos carnosus TaxID=1234261 RepID=A0A8S2D9C9_9BILA|nr:unnamed protein product [Didymodactylos carnosus]CAF3623226.1 unnamed protein product [Didymodactylos carnosus]
MRGKLTNSIVQLANQKLTLADGQNTADYSITKSQRLQNDYIGASLIKTAQALIIGAVDEGVAGKVNQAAEQKIPVVAYDRLITSTDAYD